MNQVELCALFGVPPERVFKNQTESESTVALLDATPSTLMELNQHKQRLGAEYRSRAREAIALLDLKGDFHYDGKYDRFYYESEFVFEMSTAVHQLLTSFDPLLMFFGYLRALKKGEEVREKAMKDARGDVVVITHSPLARSISLNTSEGKGEWLNYDEEKDAFYSHELIAFEKMLKAAKHKKIKEKPTELYPTWREAYLASTRPTVAFMHSFKQAYTRMNKEVVARLEALHPLTDTEGCITIYRGVKTIEQAQVRGMSWTVAKEVALRFASKCEGQPGYVITAKVPLSAVYDTCINNPMTSYEEFEVLVDTSKLDILAKEQVDTPVSV